MTLKNINAVLRKQRLATYGLLILVLLLAGFLGNHFSPENVYRRERETLLLGGLDGNSITEIRILSGNAPAPVQLQRQEEDGQWTVLLSQVSGQDQEFPANNQRINDFLNQLLQQSRGRLVASGASSLADFGLEESETRLEIRGQNGEILKALLLGDSAGSGTEVYFRYDNENRVYQTDRAFSRSLELDFSTWTETRVLPGLVQENIQGLALLGEGPLVLGDRTIEAFSLARVMTDSGESWQLDALPGAEANPEANPEANLDAQAMNSVLRDLVSLRGLSWVQNDVMENPGHILRITLENDRVVELSLGSVEENRVALGMGERALWVSQGTLGRILDLPLEPTEQGTQGIGAD